eukprot:747939-Hanusia_phi.AAC.3
MVEEEEAELSVGRKKSSNINLVRCWNLVLFHCDKGSGDQDECDNGDDDDEDDDDGDVDDGDVDDGDVDDGDVDDGEGAEDVVEVKMGKFS